MYWFPLFSPSPPPPKKVVLMVGITFCWIFTGLSGLDSITVLLTQRATGLQYTAKHSVGCTRGGCMLSELQQWELWALQANGPFLPHCTMGMPPCCTAHVLGHMCLGHLQLSISILSPAALYDMAALDYRLPQCCRFCHATLLWGRDRKQEGGRTQSSTATKAMRGTEARLGLEQPWFRLLFYSHITSKQSLPGKKFIKEAKL